MKAQKVRMRFNNITVRRSVNEYQIMLPYNYFTTPNENDFRAFQGVAVESKVKPHDITTSLSMPSYNPAKHRFGVGFMFAFVLQKVSHIAKRFVQMQTPNRLASCSRPISKMVHPALTLIIVFSLRTILMSIGMKGIASAATLP